MIGHVPKLRGSLMIDLPDISGLFRYRIGRALYNEGVLQLGVFVEKTPQIGLCEIERSDIPLK